jgi:hypothetical protein
MLKFVSAESEILCRGVSLQILLIHKPMSVRRVVTTAIDFLPRLRCLFVDHRTPVCPNGAQKVQVVTHNSCTVYSDCARFPAVLSLVGYRPLK